MGCKHFPPANEEGNEDNIDMNAAALGAIVHSFASDEQPWQILLLDGNEQDHRLFCVREESDT
jgi:hypothetical protein